MPITDFAPSPPGPTVSMTAPTTVYFATNRVLTGVDTQVGSYGDEIVSPADPTAVTYGEAFIAASDLTADTTGAITNILNTSKGEFAASSRSDLSNSGRNLLVFIHGFDNSFENALTRAAFNREWFAASKLTAADTTVVAFSWPSLGKLITWPFPQSAYFHDQTKAGQSDQPLMRFFANLQPVIEAARGQGKKAFLLAHSMGNWALQAAVETWFAHGNGNAFLFDEAILAAADEIWTTFDYGPIGRLSALGQLARRTSIYASEADFVLTISKDLNGVQRLGQDGPDGAGDIVQFPPSKYRFVDCSEFKDYDFGLASSHQYYRRSPSVQMDIANTMAGNL
jgi:esterase/lipase superfamily enzyme